MTEQRSAEEGLRASEERFRMLSTHAPVGIFQTDVDGECVYVNERWSRLTGLTLSDAVGRGWREALHPDDVDAVAAEWFRCVEVGEPFAMDFRYLRPDGGVVWASASAVPLRDAAGHIGGHIGTVSDVTERRLAEQAVLDSERRLRTVTDNMGDVIFVYGMDQPAAVGDAVVSSS